jgi:hypothetical protein
MAAGDELVEQTGVAVVGEQASGGVENYAVRTSPEELALRPRDSNPVDRVKNAALRICTGNGMRGREGIPACVNDSDKNEAHGQQQEDTVVNFLVIASIYPNRQHGIVLQESALRPCRATGRRW